LAAVAGLLAVDAAPADRPKLRDTYGPKIQARAAAAAPAAPQPAVEQLGLARDIWIGLRSDGALGEGTLANPFNGAGEGFDAKMRELCVTNQATNLSVHLLPGTFETRGSAAWYPRSGWKIRGAGMDVTTLQLVAGGTFVQGVISPFNVVEANDVEVSDLTVDCNHSQSNSNVASGVVLWGSGNAIRRVKAINANGNYPLHENFTLFISMGLRDLSEGNVIEDCEVSSFKGTYCTAIAIGGGAEFYNTKYVQGAIRRNRVYDLDNPSAPGFQHAYGMMGARDSVFEDNYAARCAVGFNCDTGVLRDSVIRGNRFTACKLRGFALAGKFFENVTVEANFIEMNALSPIDCAIACTDAGGANRLANVKIRNNVISSVNDRLSQGGGLCLSVTDSDSVIVSGNRVDSRLQSSIQDGGRAVFFDNTDFTGAPILTPEGFGGNQVNLPRGEAGTLLLNKGSAYVIADGGPSPAANGTNLLRAYARAKAMRPHGDPRSATNRVTVFLFPGRYSLRDSALVLDGPYVDLVGLGNVRATRLESEGNTLTQTADDIALENLTLHSSAAAPPALGPQDKAAYFPADSLARTVIRNCAFIAANTAWSMRLGITYAGYYENCAAGPRAWGGPGNFAGRALNCQAGPSSFGSGGLFSGFATNCAAGASSFGGGGTGFHGYARNCTAGDESFGGSGIMIGCEVVGAISATALTTGKLVDCRIGPAPGNQPAVWIGAGARLQNCTVLANPSGTGFSIDAPVPASAAISHCRVNHGLHNVVNLVAQPYNVDDPNLE
jgi:hypothetical protein